MQIRFGRKPQRFYLPGSTQHYFDLRKLSGPKKADYAQMRMASAPPSVEARFLWDEAVVGFCLPSDQGVVVWPNADGQKGLKERVFLGLDDDYMLLLAMFWVHNAIYDDAGTKLFRAFIAVGQGELPDVVVEAMADPTAEGISDEAMAAIDEILGDESGDAGMDETLGNADGSSGANGGPDDAAASETETP